MNGNGDEALLASLIERSAELKRALVDFACGPRFERHLAPFMLRAADPDADLDEGEAISIIDRFTLQHRLPDGNTVLERFLASRPGLSAADWEMLRGWGDPVEGIFEVRGKDRDAVILLNLLDDLEYRTYSNAGPAAFRQLPKDGFAHARQMRKDRAAFIEFFGGDELVLPPAEAGERLGRARRSAAAPPQAPVLRTRPATGRLGDRHPPQPARRTAGERAPTPASAASANVRPVNGGAPGWIGAPPM